MSSRRRSRYVSHRFLEALEIRRLLSAGQLDTSFSGDGKATANFNGSLEITSVATQNGKTVVVSTASPNNTDDIAMARFNFDGSLDTSFGSAGTGVIQIHPNGDSGNLNTAEAVAIQGDGKILVAGAAGSNMQVLRFLTNGQLDHSFDGDGIASFGFGFGNDAQANSIAIQSDGKIVVAGESGFGANSFAIARLNTNGSLDASFGDAVNIGGRLTHTGKTKIDFGDESFAEAVALDYSGTKASNPNFGKIVVAGGFESGSQTKMEIIRLTTSGGLDNSFDQDGKVAFSLPTHTFAFATGLVVQGSGKYVVTGSSGPAFNQSEVFVALRLNRNGSLDMTFAGSGKGVELIGFGGNDLADTVTVGVNNRLFLAGTAGNKIALAALTPDGVLDGSFGTGGKVTTSKSGGIGVLGAVGVAYIGDRVVAAGGSGSVMNVARFLDINPSVAVTAIITSASEQGPTPVTFIVTRDQRLPFDTDVFFTIGGTANAPTFLALKNHTADYTLSGLTIPQLVILGHSATPFVVIPANQTSTLVTLTPVDDTAIENSETATFSINNDTFYNVGTPKSATINILDNDNASTTVLNPTADAYVRDGSSAATNFGSTTDLEDKKGGSGFNRMSYLKFDVTNLSSINSVQLELFGKLSSTANPSVVTSVFSVADTSWTESGITFNNAPAAGPNPLASATITGGDIYTWDVTAYVKAQKAAGHNVVSFVLKNPNTSDSLVLFNSREAANQTPTLVIEGVASKTVGTFKIASEHTNVAVGESTNVAVTWQVPSGSWHQLHDIELRLRGDDGSLNLIDWNETDATFALFNPATGKFGDAMLVGSDNVLSNRLLDVLLKTSSIKASGPTSPIVTVTFDLRFNHSAAGHNYAIEAAASNDSGAQTKFGLGGSIHVT